MKIQVRQSLYSSIAFGVIFIIISFLIYILYAQSAQKSIYNNLEKTASIVALFHLEEDEMNAKDFERVRKQFDEIVVGTEYQVYNDQNKIVWGENTEEVSPSNLQKIFERGKLSFTSLSAYCYGIFYEDNQGDFIIITKESKQALSDQLISLLWILLTALMTGLLAVVLLSRWLAHIAYKPFNQVIEQVKVIVPNHPIVQIESPNTHDELQELTDTFNQLLKQISDTFIIQKNFVNYVSHEFKTPLAAILGNLEVFSLKDRSPSEYEELSQKLITQIQQLEGILSTLLVISDLREVSVLSHHFRVDELIWEIIDKLSLNYANSKVHVELEVEPSDEALLTVNKDRTQLFMALFNIIENAVKYSNGQVVAVKLYKEFDKLCISIEDKGIGIPPQELANISTPFYRGNNTNKIQGSGIGLSIALRILEKNNIIYNIQSQVGIGTVVTVTI
ncbi:sensor histidine kinase [Bacteroides propionicifaciens]|uniref:sensor histidine kinase n=1 Tax=Bacteroides propionicifaciens TaxID=392838 RepID=UPI000364A482|nr:HAMP domain-containing sensor histidine kinase [Bacteroides propionicifaciens]